MTFSPDQKEEIIQNTEEKNEIVSKAMTKDELETFTTAKQDTIQEESQQSS